MVIGLAGQHAPIRFNAHIVERGGAAFDAQIAFNRVEMAVHGGRVPDQTRSSTASTRRWTILAGARGIIVAVHAAVVAAVSERQVHTVGRGRRLENGVRVSTSRSQTGQGSSSGEMISVNLDLNSSRSVIAWAFFTSNTSIKERRMSSTLSFFNKACAIRVAVGLKWYTRLAFTSRVPLPSSSMRR